MKGIAKRIASFVLALILMLTLIPSTAVSAATYDGYLSMVDMNQYAFSFPSNYPAPFGGRTRPRQVQLWINGIPAYCLEFGVTAVSGVGYNASYSWDGMSPGDKHLINTVLMFGYNGSTHYGGNVDQEYAATQALIWMIQSGQSNTGWEDPILDILLGSGSVAKAVYYQIKANVYGFQTVPSFCSRSNNSATPVHELVYNTATGLFEVVLNDSNGVLSQFNFSTAGYSMTRNGNQLSITTPILEELVTVGSAKNLPGVSAGLIKYWTAGGYQTLASYGYLLSGESLSFTITALNYTKTLTVKFKDAPAMGKIEIFKVGEMVSTIVAEETPYPD